MISGLELAAGRLNVSTTVLAGASVTVVGRYLAVLTVTRAGWGPIVACLVTGSRVPWIAVGYQ